MYRVQRCPAHYFCKHAGCTRPRPCASNIAIAPLSDTQETASARAAPAGTGLCQWCVSIDGENFGILSRRKLMTILKKKLKAFWEESLKGKENGDEESGEDIESCKGYCMW